MKRTSFLIITKQKLIIGIAILFFICSIFASGITQNNNYSTLEKRIIIDAGHGGIDTGTRNNGTHEKDINLSIAKHLANYLNKGNMKIIMSRASDSLYQNNRNKDIIYRAKLANQENTDLFISIHVNSFPSTKSFGGQTFYTPNSAKSKKLAKFIQKELIAIQPKNYRQVKPGAFYVLERTKMPAVLVEVGFLSNPEDYQRLTNNKTRKKIAKAIEQGIINYLNSNLHLPPSNKEKPASLTNNYPKEKITIDNNFKLYFAEANNNQESLTPVAKEIPVTKIFTNNQSLIENIAYRSLLDLISGPKPNSNLYPVIPPETKLLGIEVKNDIAYVNFSEELTTNHWGGSTSEILTVSSIVKTLTQFSEIEKVQILISGKKIKSINGHLLLNNAITKKDLPL